MSNLALEIPAQSNLQVADLQPRAVLSKEILDLLRRMTILVGAVGKDGIVLAADKKFLQPAPCSELLHDMSGGRKINHLESEDKEWGIVYAFAGDEVAKIAGDAIKANLKDGSFVFSDIDASLTDAANRAVSSYTNRTGRNPDLQSVPRHLIAILYGKKFGIQPSLWRVNIQSNNCSTALNIDELVIAGAHGNFARFFGRYCMKDSSVERLERIAAHMVLKAHDYDSLAIEGFHIVKVTNDGVFHEMTRAEEDELRQKSAELDRTMTTLFD